MEQSTIIYSEVEKGGKNMSNDQFKQIMLAVTELSTDIKDMKQDISYIKKEQSVMKQDISDIKLEQSAMKQDIHSIKDEIKGIRNDINLIGRKTFDNERDIMNLKQ